MVPEEQPNSAEGPSLAERITLARIRRIEDATELDLIQFLLSKGGEA